VPTPSPDSSYGSWRCWKQLNRRRHRGWLAARVSWLMRAEWAERCRTLANEAHDGARERPGRGRGSREAALRGVPSRRALGLRFHLRPHLGGVAYLAVVARMCTAARSSAGSLPRTCARASSTTHCRWRIAGRANPDEPLVAHHRTTDRSTPRGATPNVSPTPGSSRAAAAPGDRVGQRDGRERDRDDQDRTDEENACGGHGSTSARAAHLHRLVQPAAATPLPRRQHPERRPPALPARHARPDRIRPTDHNENQLKRPRGTRDGPNSHLASVRKDTQNLRRRDARGGRAIGTHPGRREAGPSSSSRPLDPRSMTVTARLDEREVDEDSAGSFWRFEYAPSLFVAPGP